MAQEEAGASVIRIRWYEILLFALIGVGVSSLVILPFASYIDSLFSYPDATPLPLMLLPAPYVCFAAATAGAHNMAWALSFSASWRWQKVWLPIGVFLNTFVLFSVWCGITAWRDDARGDVFYWILLVSYGLFLYAVTLLFLKMQGEKRKQECVFRELRFGHEQERDASDSCIRPWRAWRRRLLQAVLATLAGIASGALCWVFATFAAWVIPFPLQLVLYVPLAVGGPVVVIWYAQKWVSWL